MNTFSTTVRTPPTVVVTQKCVAGAGPGSSDIGAGGATGPCGALVGPVAVTVGVVRPVVVGVGVPEMVDLLRVYVNIWVK